MLNYQKVLVLAVGGGNDSVSTLLLQLQLQKDFNYNPEHIDIVAVLPDCLDYANMVETPVDLVSLITPDSIRMIGDKQLNAFPERILAQNKNIIPSLNVKNIFGISMAEGSVGIEKALISLVSNNDYDLVFGMDVGGDFIAHKENLDVLSPMMDGYMLYALKGLESHINNNDIPTELLFSIFGLGTDGESTSEMLNNAMSLISDIRQYSFKKDDVTPFVNFYRNIVEKNRYSRTTDYTIQEICGERHPNPSDFRGRFHLKTSEEKSDVYYGYFSHLQNESFFGKYYLFKDISKIENVYAEKAENGIKWFLNVQKQDSKINHELNGQSYSNIGKILNSELLDGISLFFATPSRKFNETDQIKIAKGVGKSIENKVYDIALVYNQYVNEITEDVITMKINNDLTVVSLSMELIVEFQNKTKMG